MRLTSTLDIVLRESHLELDRVLRHLPGRRITALARSAAGIERVVKLFAAGEMRGFEREALALRMLEGRDVPVPTLVAVGEGPDETTWLSSTVLDGSPLPPFEDKQTEVSVYRALGSGLADLHSGTEDVPGWGDLDRPPVGSLSDVVIPRSLRFVEVARSAAPDAAARRLVGCGERLLTALAPSIEAATAYGAKPVLAHRDFGTSNVFFVAEGDGWRVSGIFDFEDAYAADPAEDFKWIALDGPGRPGLRAALSGYEGKRALDAGAHERILFYLVELALDVCSWTGVPGHRAHAFDVLMALDSGWRP